MRTFDYQHLPRSLYDGELANAHALLYEDKGRLGTIEQLHPEVLAGLEDRALFDNTDASTHIEGLYADAMRTKEIVALAASEAGSSSASDEIAAIAHFEDELENQIAGYARALRLITTEQAALDLSTSTILTLYETLFGHRDLGRKSRYRKKDYLYVQVDGHPQAMPVSPITAFETPLVLGGACDSLAESFDMQTCSPLVLAAVFTVDFMCIRPFDEGNGRVARLFASLMLEKAGFKVARYVGSDRLIEESAMDYYDALNACVNGWDAAQNDYTPYALYWFDVLHRAHMKLFVSIDLELRAGNSKAERVRLIASQANEPLSKRDIIAAVGNVSEATVEAVLGEMVKEGLLEKVGAGRATKYLPKR